MAQVIYSTVMVRNYLRHDLYSPNIILATVVNPNLVSVVPRPFGCGVILGGYDRDGPQLYMIEPSGVSYVSCYCIT